MELKVSKEITCKWQDQRSETNKYVSWVLIKYSLRALPLIPGRQTYSAALRQSLFPVVEVAHFFSRKGAKRRRMSHEMVNRFSHGVEVQYKL